jgi:hypothetical protein
MQLLKLTRSSETFPLTIIKISGLQPISLQKFSTVYVRQPHNLHEINA